MVHVRTRRLLLQGPGQHSLCIGIARHSASDRASSQSVSGCADGESKPARTCRNHHTGKAVPPEKRERRRRDFTGQN